MTFLEPDRLWLLLMVPAAVLLAAWLWRRRLAVTATWAFHGLWPALLPGYRARRLVASLALFSLVLAVTILALARPTWGTVEEVVELRGLDIAFVLDSSLSMAALDVPPSRLAVAKLLIDDLVRSLPGSRVALVQFEGEGVVLAPLTLDRGVVRSMLESVEPGNLPTPGSVLDQGIEAALGLLPQEKGAGRPAIVLVSDGEDHSPPRPELLRHLRESPVVIHAVGVGTPNGSPLPVAETSGFPFKLDRDGRQVVSRLEPERLQQLAAATGGLYLEVREPYAELGSLRDALLDMGTRSAGSDTLTQRRERFQWFLAAAAALLALQLAAGPFRGGRHEQAARGSA